MTEGKATSATAQFEIGQIVHHRLFDYRGVILDVDPDFQGGEEWYQKMARSHPPKDKPWYHLLVDNSEATTYVAERNLEPSPDLGPIHHSLLAHGLMRYEDGHYVVKRRLV
ncbi:MAG: heat shock protein HspQ [Rhodospirillaceae bacterium]|jgi:heat shock protein HspQ|nr:heat shock protein HspQ [Rhodospirillaceae bacterium]MBT4426248.1 heat shock protein HspQ [Rhodospirillaceae bacterium]MBT5675735.1 heat shock protein HspQ [Rhodospirillaceae bacterium]MBT5778734.1 heat shock protein HspQ [Rhodospirillaceae bacterium]MBT7293465.1 heat shock protein HspQ [Rhodospirillaceae bacterium]